MWSLNDRFPGKYDFEEYKNLQKQNIELPKKHEQQYKDILRNEFVKHFGMTNPVQSDVAIFNIKMELESECSRILAMPWKDYHLHKFCVYNQYDKNLVMDEPVDGLEFDPEKEEESERQMAVANLLEKADKLTGGPYGFAAIQKIISNPEHKEYAKTMEWLKSTRWKPLDMEDIQRMLQTYFLYIY